MSLMDNLMEVDSSMSEMEQTAYNIAKTEGKCLD